MFVKNPNSIKRQTIHVNDDTKKYLIYHGLLPVSKDPNGWIYFSNTETVTLINSFRGGDG